MMNKRTRWPWLSAVVVLLTVLMGACQGESPTSPPSPSPGPGPVSNPTVTVTVSNRNPQAKGTSRIEVTVTKDGQAVPDGTPVEMLTDLGFFVENGLSSLLRTTVGGKVTATLTSDTAGTASVAIRVLEVIKRETIVFGAPPTVVVLSASDLNPSPGSNVTVTATVSQDGTRVPDGIVVEFVTNFGTFAETLTNLAQKTTVNGVASVTLVSNSGGTATVTGRALAADGTTSGQATINIAFERGVAATITSITPSSGSPAGGEVVVIKGQNFVTPVRVLFDDKEAAIISATPTEITVRTPRIDLGPSTPTKVVTIRVINAAGTADETSVTATQRFTYRIEIVTPGITAVLPSSGPNEGNTRVSIVGEGFQVPVKVYFIAPGNLQVEADIVQVLFNQIIVMTPPALGLGAELRDQQVGVRVLNVNSNTSAILAAAYRYGPRIQVISAGPTEGPVTGGTTVLITGYGFDDPVAVTLAGVAAQVIRVSGTEIIVITSGIAVRSCDDVPGPIVVTNLEDGSQGIGPEFIYRIDKPAIVDVTPAVVTAGGTVTISVAFPGPVGAVRFTLGTFSVIPTLVSGDDTFAVYSMVVPSNFKFGTRDCVTAGGLAGTQLAPEVVDVVFTNTATTCTDTLKQGLTVNPVDMTCAAAALSSNPSSLAFGNQAVGTQSAARTFVVTNNGTIRLTLSAAQTGDYTVSGIPGFLDPGQSQTVSVTFAPGATGARNGNVTITGQNGTTKVTTTVAFSGTGI